jgi:hypothetical protein
MNGCVLASAFFPDAGRHELVIYPRMFAQNRKEPVDTLIHEIGHTFKLRLATSAAIFVDDSSARCCTLRQPCVGHTSLSCHCCIAAYNTQHAISSHNGSSRVAAYPLVGLSLPHTAIDVHPVALGIV